MLTNSDALKHRIRDAADILDLAREHTQLVRRGRDWWGLCPFHDERTPSFKVDPQRGSFKCFGCNSGGDVFSFQMQIADQDFPTALRSLAARYNIPTDTPQTHVPQPVYRAPRKPPPGSPWWWKFRRTWPIFRPASAAGSDDGEIDESTARRLPCVKDKRTLHSATYYRRKRKFPAGDPYSWPSDFGLMRCERCGVTMTHEELEAAHVD